MATILQSPGVAVSVTDESAYGSPGTGTIPLVILATRSNKQDPTGTYADGMAFFTKPSNAGRVVTVTSQRELTQFFGSPKFRTGTTSAIEGDETHEYGLNAVYSYLGQGSLAYVVRADIDLAKLEPVTSEPSGPVTFGSFWLDSDSSSYGVHEWNGLRWVKQSVVVESKTSDIPPTSTSANGDYAVVVAKTSSEILVKYYITAGGNWTLLNDSYTDTVTYSTHYQAPANPSVGDIWIKTTNPGGGVDFLLYRADIAGVFEDVTVQGVTDTVGSADFIAQDGLSLPVITTLINGDSQLKLLPLVEGGFEIQFTAAGAATSIEGVFLVQPNEPIGVTADGEIWFNDGKFDLDILIRGSTSWERAATETVLYNAVKPSLRADATALEAGDIWVDLSASDRSYPALSAWSGTVWVAHDNTDQTTETGVVFADITDATSAGAITQLIDNAPNPLLYPDGMLAVNMAQSANTVRRYSSADSAWRNYAVNNADGSGSFGRYAQRKVITNAMQAAVSGNDQLREETQRFTILAAPNYPELYDEMISVNSDRGETGFILVDAPMRLSPANVPAWIQGQNATENGEDGLINKNTYSGVFYPSGRATTPAGFTTTVPASHIMLYQISFNDNIAWPWFAAAGLTRGIVQNAEAVGYINSEDEFTSVSLSQGQRDVLYQNKVNPIVNFPDEGLVVFGNKTLHPVSSALDRINVARLTAYLRERFMVIGRPFLFEQNDKPTRDRAKSVYEKFLFDIVAKRGITDFAVVCDSTNNTPLRIDRNELWLDVAIVPTKSIEAIYIPIRLVATGSSTITGEINSA